jgi:hypothetical protein
MASGRLKNLNNCLHRPHWIVLLLLCLPIRWAFPVMAQGDSGNPFELAAVSDGKAAQMSVNGQREETRNPFDILSRNLSSSDSVATLAFSNPFEMVHASVTREENPFEGNGSAPLPTARYSPPSLALNFGLITGLLVLLTLAITGARETLHKSMRALTNENWLRVLYRDNQRRTSLSIPWLMVIGFFSIGFFVFTALSRLGVKADYSLSTYFLLSGTLLILHLARQLVIATAGLLSGTREDMGRYRLGLTVFAVLPGMALFPISMALAFVPGVLVEPVVYFGLAIFGVPNVSYVIRAFATNLKGILKHKFQFFLYLCIVEIAPVLLILKLLLDISGKV